LSPTARRAVPVVLAALALAGGAALGSSTAGAAATGAGVLVSKAAPPNGVAGQDRVYSLAAGGLTRSYRLYVPPTLPTSGGARLLVVLHPLNGSAAAMESTTNFDAGAAANKTLVAYPAGVGNSWNAGTCCTTAQAEGVDDVGFINAVISDVEAKYAVNADKLAVGGFSNGGLMTYRYACEQSARVHTFFIASGDNVAPSCSFSRPVALLHMHGMLDPTVPFLGTLTSPVPIDGMLPPIPSVLDGVASLDGCAGWTTSLLSTGATKKAATNCPAGASVTLVTSPDMGHFWVTGAASATFDLNETGLVWSFVLSQ
jgi:polyhydroxybutyrate depolymerase